MIGTCLGSFSALIWHGVKMYKSFKFTFNVSMVIESLKFSFPVIPHALGGYLFMYSDIIILEKYVELAVIGIYAIGLKFALLLKAFVNAFNSAFTPIFYERCKEEISSGTDLVKKTTKFWLILLAVAYCFLSHLSEYTIKILTPSNFHDAIAYVPILALCYICRGVYIFHLSTFYYCKKTSLLAAATLTSGILTVLLN